MRPIVAMTCLGLSLLQTGCRPMLYPAARAFGGPSEGELKKCRTAFNALKARILTARIVVSPPLDPTGRRAGVFEGTGEILVARMLEKGAAGAVAARDRPGVEATPLGANQMRYTWSRARAYREWVRGTHPEGDFFLFVEILEVPPGTVGGIMACVVDAAGQPAYVRLMNSHHFGGKPPKDAQAACELVVSEFFHHLRMRAEEVFPPYGVG